MIKNWNYNGILITKDTGDADYTKWIVNQDHLTDAMLCTTEQVNVLETTRTQHAQKNVRRLAMPDSSNLLELMCEAFEELVAQNLTIPDSMQTLIDEVNQVKLDNPITD